MFAQPRPKKSILPPPNKKRKQSSTTEEIAFDDGAREEYLTGFHKRKQQRIKHAQEEAAKRARQERLDTRKQIREERRREVAEHVEAVNKLLRDSGAVTSQVDEDESAGEGLEDWDGFPDKPDLELIDAEEEYVDEDRYTTVTIESVSVSRNGLGKPGHLEGEQEDRAQDKHEAAKNNGAAPILRKHARQKKNKKFRYETKAERHLTEIKRRIKSRG